MLRILAALAVLLPIVASGCAWQANNASQAVIVNPLLIGSGEQVISPAGGGDDMRSRR